MTLLELLAKFQEGGQNPMIALGAKASFLYIAPMEEMLSYLRDNPQFLKRKVIRAEYEPSVQKGYVVIIEGDERGKFAVREEVVAAVTGKKQPKRPLQDVDERGVIDLIGAVMSEFIDDIRDYIVFEYFTLRGGRPLYKLNRYELTEYRNKKMLNDSALQYLTTQDRVKLSRKEIEEAARDRARHWIKCEYQRIFNKVPIDKLTLKGGKWTK